MVEQHISYANEDGWPRASRPTTTSRPAHEDTPLVTHLTTSQRRIGVSRGTLVRGAFVVLSLVAAASSALYGATHRHTHRQPASHTPSSSAALSTAPSPSDGQPANAGTADNVDVARSYVEWAERGPESRAHTDNRIDQGKGANGVDSTTPIAPAAAQSHDATLSATPLELWGPRSPLGVCWAPQHNWNFPGNIDAVLGQDFALIRRHFQLIRTFDVTIFGRPIMPAVAAAGLKAALGVHLFFESPSFSSAEIEAAKQAYYQFPDNVVSIYVGNEDLIPVGPFNVDQIIGYVQYLRDSGVRCPIGTVQRITEWLSPSPELDRLAAAVDLIGVNIYQYFSPGGGDSLQNQWGRMMARYPSMQHKIRVTETGWPSAGGVNFAGQTATLGQAKWHYDMWVSWVCGEGGGRESYYFTYFDGRTPTNPDYEQFFGVTDADGQPKFQLANGFCGRRRHLAANHTNAVNTEEQP